MKKKNVLILTLLFCCSALYASAQTLPDPTGLWETEGGKSIVEVTSVPENKTWAAKIVWLKDSLDEEGKPKRDVENPDAQKKGNTIIGLTIAWGFSADKKNLWKGGKVYDPETGKTYKGQVKMKDGKLELRGYIGIPAFGRSTSWTQISHIPQAMPEAENSLPVTQEN